MILFSSLFGGRSSAPLSSTAVWLLIRLSQVKVSPNTYATRELCLQDSSEKGLMQFRKNYSTAFCVSFQCWRCLLQTFFSCPGLLEVRLFWVWGSERAQPSLLNNFDLEYVLTGKAIRNPLLHRLWLWLRKRAGIPVSCVVKIVQCVWVWCWQGYYARWSVMRQLLFQFLDADSPALNDPPPRKQILSLGAGFDTSFFQLVVRGLHCRCSVNIQIYKVHPQLACNRNCWLTVCQDCDVPTNNIVQKRLTTTSRPHKII